MGSHRRPPSNAIRKRRRKKKKSDSFLFFWLVFIIIAGCSGYVAWYLFMPSNEFQDFHTYYDLPPNEIIVVMRDKRLEDLSVNPVDYNGTVCFPLDFVKEYLDPFVFWDENAQKLTITMPDKVLRFMPDQLNYYENGNPVAVNVPVYLINGDPYLPAELLTHIYHISLDYHLDNKIIMLGFLVESRETGVIVSEKAVLRFLPDKKKPLSYRFSRNEKVDVFGQIGDYTRVKAENGLLGYVLTEQIESAGIVPGIPNEAPPAFPSPPPINGKVNMIWDQVYRAESNAISMSRTIEDGLDVISPTWFSFDMDLSGDIISLADVDYVNWAHEHGCQVWPLLSDFSSDTTVVLNQDISHNILSDTDKREHVIKQLMAFIAMYKLDGINIDFEYIQPEDAVNYVEFFRELGPYMKSAGAVLSVDMYNPDKIYWSRYYNRLEVGGIADYICVMSYDEYKNDVSGPVASMPFVRSGMEKTLLEVPKEKILLGIPYYVRVWREETADGVTKTTRQDRGMDYGYKLFNDNNADISWDSAFGSFYASFKESGNVVYKAWLEEERSIEEKLTFMQNMDLAGVAGWSWGLESDQVWDLLRRYVK